MLALLVAMTGPLPAQNLRVTTQVVEVPYHSLTAWTRGEMKTGPEMHRLAWDLVEKGEARVVDTSIVTGKRNYRIVGESKTECIYPTEADSYAPIPVPSEPAGGISLFPFAFRYAPTAFETRNAGTSIEAFATGIEEEGIHLGLCLEIVGAAAASEWKTFRDGWGDASIRFPTFRTHRERVELTLEPGRYEWIGVMNAEPVALPVVETRRLVFVRVELLATEETE